MPDFAEKSFTQNLGGKSYDRFNKSAPPPYAVIQPKLMVASSDNPLEIEADQAADRVVNFWQNGSLKAPGATPSLIKPLIQRRAVSAEAGAMQASPEVTQQIQAAKGGGQALPATLQPSLEAAFGMDFSGVRLHTDARADALNRDLQARAFTTGQDVFFREGEYRPHTAEGVRLLGHELGHVGQQEHTNHKIQRVVISNPEARRTIPSIDYIYEELAKRFAYKDRLSTADEARLRELGYLATKISGLASFDLWVFTPFGFGVDGRRAVLAFRGSQQLVDWLDDFNPAMAGPGAAQTFLNADVIGHTIDDRRHLSANRKVDLIGHSLGGALAQFAATLRPEAIHTMVTFQSPGLPQRLLPPTMRGRLSRIQTRYYRITGDVVPEAGQAFVPGSVMTFSISGISTPGGLFSGATHTSFPLSTLANSPDRITSITSSQETGVGSGATLRGLGEVVRQRAARSALSTARSALNFFRTSLSHIVRALGAIESAIVAGAIITAYSTYRGIEDGDELQRHQDALMYSIARYALSLLRACRGQGIPTENQIDFMAIQAAGNLRDSAREMGLDLAEIASGLTYDQWFDNVFREHYLEPIRAQFASNLISHHQRTVGFFSQFTDNDRDLIRNVDPQLIRGFYRRLLP